MRGLPDPGFAGDEGAADEALAAALAAYDEQPDVRERWLDAVALLQDTRVLVPVVAEAVGGRAESRPPTDDKYTDMAAVLMRSRSGRTALLAFTGLDTMRDWDPAARPVPVAVPDAARAALQNGAEALVVDVAGPVLLAVEGEDLRSLAGGERLARVGAAGWGWVRPG
jgi:hypothetical protein